MDSKFRKITLSTDTTVPIFGMDMGFNNHDSSIISRQTFENFKRIENCKKENLQKENDF
jgi:hypothetical protein